MERQDSNASNDHCRTRDHAISRRLALGSSGVTMLGLLSRSAFGRAQGKGATPQLPKEFQERVEKDKAFMERLRHAGNNEERQQIMSEQMAWQRQRAVEDLKDQLGFSDREWSVVKPRLQVVYDLVHPRSPMVGRNEPPKTEIEQRSRELRELLRDDSAGADRIKGKLAAFRTAKERVARELAAARESLRQILTLRQEVMLVLNELLD